MRENIATVVKESFFDGIGEDYAKRATETSVMVEFHRSDVLFRTGEPANHFYIIQQGEVALEIDVPGTGAIAVDSVREDELLGWSWVFPPYQWHFTARAIQHGRAFIFNAVQLREDCEADPKLACQLLRKAGMTCLRRLVATQQQLAHFYALVGASR